MSEAFVIPRPIRRTEMELAFQVLSRALGSTAAPRTAGEASLLVLAALRNARGQGQ